MRQIKFRAWESNKKRMHEDTPTHKDYNDSLVSPFIYMQFTGLKDKNGKEIYEGDVVKYRLGDESAVYLSYIITWDDLNHKWFGRQPRNKKGQIVDGVYSGGISGQDFNREWKLEVLGNIYENLELLKEAKA